MKTPFIPAIVKALTFSICLLCIAPSEAQEVPKKDSKLNLYILIGQSNMAGRGVITSEYQEMHDERVLMFNAENKWVEARHPLHFDKPKVAGVGPGLSFGLEMAKANPEVKIGLIPCAVGGTPIEAWQPGAQDKATKKFPYDEALLRIKEAMKYGVVKGVVWHQGEGNSSEKGSETYLAQLSELIKRVRKETKNKKLPFVVGELGRYRDNYAFINDKIKDLPGMVKYTAVASSEGLVHKGDGTHLDSPSATLLGKRMAEKMIALQK
jgi:hypothetical protein